jgi:ADP-dependent NAD(P)H-hydrate dehydratase
VRRPRRITTALLRGWPLPQPHANGDKESRGRVLVVAGSDETPGAAILAANGAFRAGAGKVQVATTGAAMASVAQAVPEARVTRFAPSSVAQDVDAAVVGPGMNRSKSLLRYVAKQAMPLVIDAAALHALDSPWSGAPAIVTPHAGEMAGLLDGDKDAIERHPDEVAVAFARDRGVLVVLKGAVTYVAAPDGGLWTHEHGNIGLAVSGSGDVLAGVIGGLLARGCNCAQAAVWGVALHARAGERMVARHGPLGGLPRELPDYIPREMNALAARTRRR